MAKEFIRKKQYTDKTGETENMNPQELFALLQSKGYISKDEKFENWKFRVNVNRSSNEKN